MSEIPFEGLNSLRDEKMMKREIRTADRSGKLVTLKTCFSRHLQAYVINFPQDLRLEEVVVHGGSQEATSLLIYAMQNARKMDSLKDLAELVSQEAWRRAELAPEEEFEGIPPTLRSADVENVRKRLKGMI